MKRSLGLCAGISLLALAGCGDSAIVERCMEEGKSAKSCRCADRIFRSDLSNEEYRIVEKAAEGEDEAMARAFEEKGAGFALAFASKMAGTSMKIAQRCSKD